MAKIRKGDSVIVLKGRSRGHVGQVLRVDPKEQRALVEGAAMGVRHVKPSVKNPEGGRILKECPIHISNLAIFEESTQMSTRVGFRFSEAGQKVRYAKRSGAQVGE